MNKDKLVSLIVKKQTYKDTKPYLNELGAGKENAAKISAEAIRDILATDYIAQTKLYAVRFLKDAFEKGNPAFINLVQTSLLPILLGIAVDEADEKAVTKYAGSSYTKSQELEKFKSILMSLFRIAKQCIIKWGQWIPDANRKFTAAVNQLKKKKVNMDFEFKYFREENQQLFKESCKKNGVSLSSAVSSSKKVVPPPSTTPASAPKQKKDPLVQKVQTALAKVESAKTKQEFQTLENDFNEALNNYLQNAADFQDTLVQAWFDGFQQKKTITLQKIEGGGQTKNARTKNSSFQSHPPLQEKNENKLFNQDKGVIEKSLTVVNNIQRVGGGSEKQIDKSISIAVNESVSVKKLPSPVGTPANSSKKVAFSKEGIQDANNEEEFELRPHKETRKNRRDPDRVKSPKVSTLKIDSEIAIKPKETPIPSIPTKGPLIFDDFEEQIIPKNFQKEKAFERSRPEITQNRPIRPTGEESRSPQATQISKSSKQFTESKASKMSIEPKVQKPAPRENIKAVPARQNLLAQLQMSKESQRVSFSQEEESEQSQDIHLKIGNTGNIPSTNFKKKPNLMAIVQENDSHHTSENHSALSGAPPVRSRIHDEKASVANKLLQQNKVLLNKLENLERQFNIEKESLKRIANENQKIEKQLQMRRESQEKLVKKLKSSVPIQDYNNLKKELDKQREAQLHLHQENQRLKTQQNTLIEQLNETKHRMNNISLRQQSKVGHQVESRIVQARKVSDKNILGGPPIHKEEVDQDYIKNLTHPSNMHNWLSETNILLFKRSVLSLSQIFYRDEYVTMLAKSNVYTQNDKQFLSLKFTFQFKSLKKVQPVLKYKNCQELDLWTKPVTGDQLLYAQELVVKLHRNPLKILKGELKIIQGLSLRFLLPFMYINFLREQQFSLDQFQDILSTKAEHLLKSKIVSVNPSIIRDPQDFKRVFKTCTISEGKIRFCLSQGISDCIFMTQIELLRNNKVIIRMLPIPATEQMNYKARQLLDDLIFLIS